MNFKNQLKNNMIKKIVKNIFKIFFGILIIINVIYNVQYSFDGKKYITIGKFSFLFVQTNEMEKELKRNDFIIIKNVDINKIEENDIVAYYANNNVRVNRVIKIYNNDSDGKITYVTKFDKNYLIDSQTMTSQNYIGKEIFKINKIGLILKIAQNKIFTIIIIIILLVVVWIKKEKEIRDKKRSKRNKRNQKKKRVTS